MWRRVLLHNNRCHPCAGPVIRNAIINIKLWKTKWIEQVVEKYKFFHNFFSIFKKNFFDWYYNQLQRNEGNKPFSFLVTSNPRFCLEQYWRSQISTISILQFKASLSWYKSRQLSKQYPIHATLSTIKTCVVATSL